MKIFLAFVKKEIFHILRDTRTLVILFGMPIALVIIFGYTITNEFKDASMAIYDQSKDNLSSEFIQHMRASGHFKLVSYCESIDQVEESFKAGLVKVAIVIPANFERDFYRNKETEVQILSDATEPNYAETLTSYANRMVKRFQFQKSKINGLPYQISIETRMLYNPKLNGAYYFIPGVVALILMLICAMMTSLTIAKEKEMGTMDLLLVSPLHPLVIILGKVTPYAVLSFTSALMVFAMGYYLFKVPIIGSLAALLALNFLYLLVALSLGLLISTKAPNQQVAMILSMFVLMLPTMLLSGFIFPIDSMPLILQWISKIIPAKYFIIIEKAIMLKGAGWESIKTPSLILLLMFFLLVLAAFRNFKVRYK